MRRMGISWVVAVVLTWSGAAAQPAVERRTMLQEADAIWRAHGVGVVAVGAGAGRSRRRPPTVRLDVRLARPARRPTAPLRRERLGAILFDHDNLPATTLTIDVAAVEAIVARTRWGGQPFDLWPPAWRDTLVGRALGRVLAHEIGHYLLASRVHTAEGLMRASFDGDELLRPARDGFAIAARDLPRLRAEARRAGPRFLACGERALVRILTACAAPRATRPSRRLRRRPSCSRCRRLRSRPVRSPTRSPASRSRKAPSTPTT